MVRSRPRKLSKTLHSLPVVEQYGSDRRLCADICQARCCVASVVVLTAAEAARLPQLAAEHKLTPPHIVERHPNVEEPDAPFAMYAQPCVFLAKNNLCRIYAERPGQCRTFPQELHSWCPLSQKHFS